MEDITLTSWLTILAIILGPIFAVRIQRYLDSRRERKWRKLNLFHTLMATRASRVSFEHVKALNMIDIEFRSDSKKYKKVTDSWKIYQDHLESKALKDASTWSDKGFDLFVNLLYEIAQALNYDFDKVSLKKSYFPQAHMDQEEELYLIRKGLVKLLAGEISLPMEVIPADSSDETLAKQEKMQKNLQELLEGKRTLKVRIEGPENLDKLTA